MFTYFAQLGGRLEGGKREGEEGGGREVLSQMKRTDFGGLLSTTNIRSVGSKYVRLY